MATFYSDAFTADGAADSTLDRTALLQVSGEVHYARARVLTSLQTTDTCMMFTFPSNARLIEMWLSSDGAGTTGTLDLGLYTADLTHTGGDRIPVQVDEVEIGRASIGVGLSHQLV